MLRQLTGGGHLFPRRLMTMVLLLFLLFTAVARSYKKNDKAPKGLAGFLEPLVLFVRDDIAKENIGEAKYKKFVPFLLSNFKSFSPTGKLRPTFSCN